jgi:hypothetical protein
MEMTDKSFSIMPTAVNIGKWSYPYMYHHKGIQDSWRYISTQS